MNSMAMNLDECDIDHEALMDEEYGDEVMSAGWNPQLPLAGEGPVAEINKHINLLDGLVNTDLETFLKTVYENQG